MNPSLWTKEITVDLCPNWACIFCSKGEVFLDAASFLKEATADARAAQKHDDFEHEWTEYTFMALSRCNNVECGQMYAIAGKGSVECERIADNKFEYVDSFEIKHVHPSPHLISIPKKTPEAIRNELLASFALYWLDGASCAGRIRLAIECLMDELNVPAAKTLNKRLDKYKEQELDKAEKLIAVKWFGNTAIHQGQVQHKDVLAAYSVIEYVLEEIYDDKEKVINKNVAMLNKRHDLSSK